MKYALFANPIAGRGAARQAMMVLEAQLGEQSLLRFFEHPRTIDDASLIGAFDTDAIIIMGGDGTLRTVINRLMQVTRDLPPIVFVGFGTENLMRKHLNLQWQLPTLGEQVRERVLAGVTRGLDVGKVGDEVFLSMLSAGFDAEIVHQLAAVRSGPITRWSYGMPAMNMLRSYTHPPTTVWVDGERVIHDLPALVHVGNVPEYGPGFILAPQAISNDRLLDVTVLPIDSHLSMLAAAIWVAAEAHVGSGNVITTRGQHIRIESAEKVPLQADGDMAGFTPAQIDLLDRQLAFIVTS